MPHYCEEQLRLRARYESAATRYHAAAVPLPYLAAAAGANSDFQSLVTSVQSLHTEMDRAREALRHHLEIHGCEPVLD